MRKLDPKALMAAYYASVRSIFEYGSTVWSGAAKTHLKRLERVQRKFLICLAAEPGARTDATATTTEIFLALFMYHL